MQEAVQAKTIMIYQVFQKICPILKLDLIQADGTMCPFYRFLPGRTKTACSKLMKLSDF